MNELANIDPICTYIWGKNRAKEWKKKPTRRIHVIEGDKNNNALNLHQIRMMHHDDSQMISK